MFKKAQTFSSWGVEPYNWLNVPFADLEKNFLKNLDSLLNTNPIIKENKPARPNGYENRLIRKRIKESVIERFVERVSSYTSSNEEFHNELEKFITNHLATSHYIFLRKIPASGRTPVDPKQFWFPASFYICGIVTEDGMNTLKMHFIDEQFCHNEFYEKGEGRRHPAIILERLQNDRFLMVPYTNRNGDGKLKMMVNVAGQAREQFAIYKFNFEVSEAMLGEPKALCRKEMEISSKDFNYLLTEVDKHNGKKLW